MNHLVALLNDLAETWSSAIFRATWQGGVAILFAWLVCRSWPTVSPRVRCWMWRLVYLKFLVAFLWYSPIQLSLLPAINTASAVQRTDPAPFPEEAASLMQPTQSLASEFVAAQPQQIEDDDIALERKPEPTASVVTVFAALNWQSWFMWAWLSGSGCCVVRVGMSWRRSARLVAFTRPAGHADREVLADLCQLFPIRRVPALAESDAVGNPLLTGVIHPTIVLPQSQRDPQTIRLMLAHELAHLKRHDLLWNWLPTLVHVLFFFHPLLWLARRQWRISQEAATDEFAIVSTGTHPSQYADMLLNAACRRFSAPATQGAIGILESYESLRARVEFMRHIQPMSRGRLWRWATALFFITIIGLVPWKVVAKAAIDVRDTDGWSYRYCVALHDGKQRTVVVSGMGDPEQCRYAFEPQPVYQGPAIDIPETANAAGMLAIERSRDRNTESKELAIRVWEDKQGVWNYGCNGPAPQFAHRASTIGEFTDSVRSVLDVERSHIKYSPPQTSTPVVEATRSTYISPPDATLAQPGAIDRNDEIIVALRMLPPEPDQMFVEITVRNESEDSIKLAAGQLGGIIEYCEFEGRNADDKPISIGKPIFTGPVDPSKPTPLWQELGAGVSRVVKTPIFLAAPASLFPEGLHELPARIRCTVSLHDGQHYQQAVSEWVEVKEPRPDPAKLPSWGEPVDGLRSRIRTSKASYRLDEQIAIYGQFENVGQKGLAVSSDVQFEVNGNGPYQFEHMLSSEPMVTVKPGDRSVWFSIGTSPKKLGMDKPGTYRIHLDKSYPHKKAPAQPGVWYGALKSNSIHVEIVAADPPAQPPASGLESVSDTRGDAGPSSTSSADDSNGIPARLRELRAQLAESLPKNATIVRAEVHQYAEEQGLLFHVESNGIGALYLWPTTNQHDSPYDSLRGNHTFRYLGRSPDYIVYISGSWTAVARDAVAQTLNLAWQPVVASKLLAVDVERTLYDRLGDPHFYLQIRLTNRTQRPVGVNLQHEGKVIYPNEWGFLPQHHRTDIDERRVPPEDIDAGRKSQLLADYQLKKLTQIPAGKSATYFREFNASGRKDVDAQQKDWPYLFISMDGQLFATDGESLDNINLSWDHSGMASSGPHSDVIINAPVSWKQVPADAFIVK